MGSTFFTLPAEYKVQLHEEIFNLSYYSQGGFTQDVVYNLPIYLRRFYIKKLVDVRKKENEEAEKAQAKAKSGARTPSKPSMSRPSMPSRRTYR